VGRRGGAGHCGRVGVSAGIGAAAWKPPPLLLLRGRGAVFVRVPDGVSLAVAAHEC
jgi:hypothetical protein